MYLCTVCVYFHLSDLIVFIYQVWVGNRMRVFPVISSLFIKQNVPSLNITAGIESDTVVLENVLKAKDKK